ncbi:MAG: ribosome-associated translation inhibitor RaiA [candidate division WOR-3 bacterium]
MMLKLSSRHVEITPHLREHISKQFERLAKLDHGIIQGEVTLTRDRAFDVAEGKIHVGHTFLTASGRGTNTYTAVNEMFDKVRVQLGKYEGRIKTRRRGRTRKL